MIRSFVGASLMLMVLSTAPAHAMVAVAVPASSENGFATTTVYAVGYTGLSLQNLDLAPHDLVAVDSGSGWPPWCSDERFEGRDCPLFASKVIASGKSGPVQGLNWIGSGSYRFYCTLHPDTMTGLLQLR